MELPFLYKGTEPLKVSAEMVFAVVKSIVDAGKEAEFLQACKEKNASVSVAPEFVNLVKTYMFERGVYKLSFAARSVVDSARCQPD